MRTTFFFHLDTSKRNHTFHFLSHQFQFNWNLSGECRELAFPSFYFFANKRLENHNIITVRVRDMSACELRCYHEPNCVSINFHNTANAKGTYRCDLNNATHRGHDVDFVRTEGYLYRGADVSCCCCCCCCSCCCSCSCSCPCSCSCCCCCSCSRCCCSSSPSFFFPLVTFQAFVVCLREVVNTTIPDQDPPNHRIDGGLCLHPLSQRQVMAFNCIVTSLCCSKKTVRMRFKPHFYCLS